MHPILKFNDRSNGITFRIAKTWTVRHNGKRGDKRRLLCFSGLTNSEVAPSKMRGMTDRDAIFIRYPVITKNYIPKIPGRILTSFHLFQLLILSKFKIAA